MAKKIAIKAHFDKKGKLVLTHVVNGCVSCPFGEEHVITTPDSFDHAEGVYCSLKKEKRPYPGAATDKKKVFEYDSPSEKKRFENYIPDWCPFRGKKEG